MQLNHVRRALASATCALLGGHASAAPDGGDGWSVESAVLYYGEKDRVQVLEPTLFASRELDDENRLVVRGVVDVMSGATPNGAVPTDTPQTFTTASSRYTVDADAPPRMDFEDLRLAFGFDWERTGEGGDRRLLTGDVSVETDYLSMGGGGTWSWDTRDRLTTLSLGVGGNFDWVFPGGGPPAPLDPLDGAAALHLIQEEDDDDDEGEGGEGGFEEGEARYGVNTLLGVTQVLSRGALLQLNWTHAEQGGYLNDPYKLLSVVGADGRPVGYRWESRPDRRSSDALFGRLVWQLPLLHHVVHLGHRYYRDDWGVEANTTDLKYRIDLGRRLYLQPHLRYHRQGAADFYRYYLVAGEPLPDHASADYRLAEMESRLAGLKVARETKSGEMALRLEYMVQSGESHPDGAPGILTGYDLYPDLEAAMVQFTWSFRF
ncbi:MAG TPA: DUF3570 domain-containing protein [Thiotrichales bacterium]|nr:DUF3570 domain-containing protein [Thiotrichales bacterium]